MLIVLLGWKEVTVLEITAAEEAGFCFGVKRAIDMARKAAEDSSNHPVYTLGPIIHNPQVVSKLEERGIKAVNSIKDINEGTIIIRSHGIEPEIFQKARNRGLHIIDATCPFVKKAQKFARELVEEDYQTFIFGDRNHPEVKGIYGATNNKARIINSLEQFKAYEIGNRIGFVAQTTQSPEAYNQVIKAAIPRSQEIKVYNTICNTTETRQKSAIKLADRVDIMIVIGGYNSANTNRLAEICRNTETPTYHVETARDLDRSWLERGQKIGITAGASTPDWLIKEVIQAMNEEKQEMDVQEVKDNQEQNISSGVDEEVEEMEEKVEETEEVEEVTEEVAEAEEVETEDTMDAGDINYSDNDIADLKKGQKVTGTIVELNDDGVYVDVGYKTEGFIPLRELSHRKVDDPSEVVADDEEIEVVILTLEDEEGNMILSKKQADYEKAWEKIMEAYENDEIIEAKVTKEVKGGLVVDVGVRGFIPASHVAIGYVEDLSQYVGETLKLKVIEVERDKNNVVLSAKKVLEAEREEQKEETLEALEEGQTIEGKVTKLVDFGAFIDLGGIEGLLHISEMSWGRIGHPSDVLTEGEYVEVKVLGVDKENERISLGLKQLLPDPWEEFAEKHYEGEIIEGKITKIVDFGAFMEIETGIEGLIHISQLSHKHVKTPDEVVTVGEERDAKIINIDAEQKRVGLSLKELEDEKPSQDKQQSSSGSNQDSGSGEEKETPSGATIGELVGDIFNDEE
ncbi:MAG: bifunctional 4-hydroxy-3-methylbut-2-enyl diphosphate reductase/30S ribosomal protein S1 [Bacillota bacterium]